MTIKFNKLAFEIVEENDKEKRRKLMLEMLDEVQVWLKSQLEELKFKC